MSAKFTYLLSNTSIIDNFCQITNTLVIHQIQTRCYVYGCLGCCVLKQYTAVSQMKLILFGSFEYQYNIPKKYIYKFKKKRFFLIYLDYQKGKGNSGGGSGGKDYIFKDLMFLRFKGSIVSTGEFRNNNLQ